MKQEKHQLPYYLRFGLAGDPFPVDRIDQAVYLTPELEQRLELARDRLRKGPRFQVITAPAGAGKTSFANRLLSMTGPGQLPVLVQSESGMDPSAFAAAILQQMPPERTGLDSASDINRLHKLLERLTREQTRPVLAIDDAHLLPVPTLDFLFQLSELHYGDTGFRFLLFGEERLADHFNDPAIMVFPENNIHYLQLPSLTETQTAEYIRHRILSYGHIREDPFSDETVRHIYLGSGGLPGGINYLARQAMQSSTRGRRRYVMPAMGITAGLLAATVTYFLVSSPTATRPLPEAGPVIQGPEEPAASVRGDKQTGVTDSSRSESGETNAGASARTVAGIAAGTPSPDATRTSEPANTAAASGVETASAQAEGQAVSTSRPPPSGKPAPAEPAAGMAESPPPPATAGTGTDETTETATATQTAAAAASPLTAPERSPVSRRMQTETTAPRPAPQNRGVFDLAPSPGWAGHIRGEDWLRRQARDNVLLQVISASRLQNVAGIIVALPDQAGPLSGFANYTPSGQPRYRLYYGLYPDTESAESAADTLPPGLRSLNPWPRPLEDIIEELDAKAARFVEE